MWPFTRKKKEEAKQVPIQNPSWPDKRTRHIGQVKGHSAPYGKSDSSGVGYSNRESHSVLHDVTNPWSPYNSLNNMYNTHTTVSDDCSSRHNHYDSSSSSYDSCSSSSDSSYSSDSSSSSSSSYD